MLVESAKKSSNVDLNRLVAKSYAEVYWPHGDVDIVFETDVPNLFRTSAMKLNLEELLGRHVDVLQLRGLTNPRLKARVKREAAYV